MSIDRIVRPFVLLMLAVLLPLITGCATDKQVIAQANDLHSGIKPTVINDPEVATYVQKVGDRIIAAAKEMAAEDQKANKGEDRTWMFSNAMQFHIVASDTVNAFTTGGEHMYVYTGLLKLCQDEDELAAVMGHEYGHVYCRHVQSGMNRQYAMMGAAAAAGAAGYAVSKDDQRLTNAAAFAGAAAAAGQFVGMGYTRGDERQADDMGYSFYVRAGWDPAQFDAFFKQMIKMGYDKTPELMSDHPSLASRVDAADKRTATLPLNAAQWRKPPVAAPAEFKRIRDKALADAAAMPKTDATSGAKLLLDSFPTCVAPVEDAKQKDAQKRLAAILHRPQQ